MTDPKPLPVVDSTAPAERLAMFRILLGIFVAGYLVIRMPVFLRLADRTGGFDGVGALWWASEPLPGGVVLGLTAVAIVGAIGFAVGCWFRWTGPITAIALLVVITNRSSWGQLLHFENLMVLHVLVVAASPAADAWSVDARDRRAGSPARSVRYGWPLALAALVTVVTYVIAGIAKLRYGGLDWVSGDTLRHHIAYAAARLDLLGGQPAPLARWSVSHPAVLTPLAAAAVVIELAAPVVLLGRRIRNVWVVSAWLMHVGILLTMAIAFPSPLLGIAFAPMFALERLREIAEFRPRRRRAAPAGVDAAGR